MNISYNTYPHRYPDLRVFMEKYGILSVVYCPEKKTMIKDEAPEGVRRCRFCGRDATQTTFRNEAHLIPAFLGNRYLLFYNECDNCNKIVSTFETHFSAYLGGTMSMTSTMGRKNKLPKFKAADKKISTAPAEALGKKGIMHSDHFPSGFNINLKPSFRSRHISA